MAYFRLRKHHGEDKRDRLIREQASQDALAGMEHGADIIVGDIIGIPPREFDPIADELDAITYAHAMSAMVEENRSQRLDLGRRIAKHPSIIGTMLIGLLLMFADLQANVFFFATIGIDADQRPFIAGGLTALNVVIAAVGAAAIARKEREEA